MSSTNGQGIRPTGNCSAQFSEDGRYRYLLTRRFKAAGKTCLFIMLNPSTADASIDDPTIRRCAQFAHRWDMAELRVVNLFGWRATDPSELERVSDPVGPGNDAVVRREITRADLIVAAWGNKGALGERSVEMMQLLANADVDVHHLGLNGTGEPVHPLYISAAALPVRLTPVPPRQNRVVR